MEKKRIVIIVGPTAVGKSLLAVKLASTINGQIVSADSMQVYRYMDIGTAKPSCEERGGIEHFMMDIVDPDQDFNAGMYTLMARKTVDEIINRGKTPIVVGGTGLYIKTLTRGIVNVPEKDEKLRKELLRERDINGIDSLYRRLSKVDPVTAKQIHHNDSLRIIRALEVYIKTKKPISEWRQTHSFRDKPYKTIKFGLCLERPLLYKRIEDRVEDMIKRGFVEEVSSLISRGYSPSLKSMQSVGYREICRFIKGGLSYDEALLLIKRNTKRYAKRQMTWFRKESDILWYSSDTSCNVFINEAKRFLS